MVTAQGQTLRTPFAPFRTASTKVGRRYVRLNEGDRVVMATVLKDEESLFLASASGHVLHFPLDEINILSGVGKGVIGHQAERGRYLPGRGADFRPVRYDAGGNDRRQDDGVPPRQV